MRVHIIHMFKITNIETHILNFLCYQTKMKWHSPYYENVVDLAYDENRWKYVFEDIFCVTGHVKCTSDKKKIYSK